VKKRLRIIGKFHIFEKTGVSDVERHLAAAEADWMKATELAESASGESAES